MTMREILQQLTATETEMRAIHAAQPDGALSGDAESRWTTLTAKHDGLKAAATRQAMLDDADRRSSGTAIGGTSDTRLNAEMRQFSLVRAIAGAAGLAVDAGRERELSAEVARRSGRTFQGIAVPMEALAGPVEQRVFTTGNPGGGPGSNIIASNLLADQFIDRLRAALVINPSLTPNPRFTVMNS